MGINGLLPRILPSAGRENYDLRALSDGLITLSPTFTSSNRSGDNQNQPAKKRRKRSWSRRKIRIAVDVNGWIARAAHGYGGSLMDERHLSYHGRAELRNEQQRLQQQQQQQQQQQPQHAGNGDDEAQANPNNNAPTENNSNNNNNNNNNELIQKQQRLEYITKCISFVLQRMEFLRNECSAHVLPVLDGATPPCKRDAVRERSDRRKRATEQRDEMIAAQSPQRPVTAAAAAAAAIVAAANDNDATATANNGESDEEEEILNEAARTEAEVLRRISASKRAGTGKDRTLRLELLGELLKEFRHRRWPLLVAPYEADGQLAYLANTGAVDLVVTEDSDLIALGVPRLVYRLGGWNGSNAANRVVVGGGPNDFGNSSAAGKYLRGTMLHRNDLGSSCGINLLDFTDAMLATMFVAAGCDYCDSLKGIGVVTARNIVKRAFHGGEADEGSYHSTTPPTTTAGDDNDDDERQQEPVLRVILNELFRSCNKDVRREVLPLDDPEKEQVRLAYERSFLAALAIFRHSMVYDPVSGRHVVTNDVCDVGNATAPHVSASFRRDESILMEYEPYRELVTKRENLYRVIGAPFDPEMAKGIAEGLIDPRQLPAPEHHIIESTSPSQQNNNDEAISRQQAEDDTTQGSSSRLQLSSQDFSGAGTQQSKSSSCASGMISSLSPDLLAPSPKN